MITRSVTYRSQTDDFPVAFWMLKIIKVKETRSSPRRNHRRFMNGSGPLRIVRGGPDPYYVRYPRHFTL